MSRRHTPYGNQTDYRIFELNKRLQNWTEVRSLSNKPTESCSEVRARCFLLLPLHLQECDNLWWDAFTTEFFEDDAMLTITFCLEDGPKRYSKKLRGSKCKPEREAPPTGVLVCASVITHFLFFYFAFACSAEFILYHKFVRCIVWNFFLSKKKLSQKCFNYCYEVFIQNFTT